MRLITIIFVSLVACCAWSGPGKDSELAPANWSDTTRRSGRELFITTCYNCHKDTLNSLAPSTAILGSMTSRAVLDAMDRGKMRPLAAALSEEERRSIAEFITRSKLKTTILPASAYAADPFIHAGMVHSQDQSGWGGDRMGTGFRSSDQAGISPANVGSLSLKWAFAFPDATIMRGKPAVVGNWLIVGGQYGDVWAIDRRTGKLGWHFEADAAIRGAIAITRKRVVDGKSKRVGETITAYFADFGSKTYAVNARTGKLIWSNRAGFDQQSAVTGSVAVYGGKIFVPITSMEVSTAAGGDYPCCVSSGGVVALDAGTGSILWRYRVLPRAQLSGTNRKGKPAYGPSGAPVWCSPTVDAGRGLLYIGTGENYTDPPTASSDAVQALDMNTGRLVWNFQATAGDTYNVACPYFNNCPAKAGPDLDFGMAPILVKGKEGKDLLLAGQKSGVVYALSPDGGKPVWRTRIGKGGALGGIHWGMATDGKYVYGANADNYVGIDKSDSSIKSAPGVYALDVLTGKLIWSMHAPDCPVGTCFNGNSAAPAAAPGLVFAGSLDGHLRAYSSKDGKVLWDFNTATDFETVDGIQGKGGSIDGPAPVLADGMLFANSGYGLFGQRSGNVLLAFGVAAPTAVVPKKKD